MRLEQDASMTCYASQHGTTESAYSMGARISAELGLNQLTKMSITYGQLAIIPSYYDCHDASTLHGE